MSKYIKSILVASMMMLIIDVPNNIKFVSPSAFIDFLDFKDKTCTDHNPI